MSSDLQLGSNHRHLALYDPAALPPDTPVDPDLASPEPCPIPETAIRDLAARGCAFFLHIPEGDCDVTLSVFVEEELPDRLRQRANRLLTGAILSAPSGRLMAAGVEFMCLPGQTRRESESVPVGVPPGDYGIEVFECVRWKRQHRTEEMAKRTTTVDRLVGRGVIVYTFLGAAMIPANLVIVPLVLALLWWWAGWRLALTTAGVIAVVDVLVLAGFRVLDVAWRRFPVFARANALEVEFDRETPDVVLALRRPAPPAVTAAPALAVLYWQKHSDTSMIRFIKKRGNGNEQPGAVGTASCR